MADTDSDSDRTAIIASRSARANRYAGMPEDAAIEAHSRTVLVASNEANRRRTYLSCPASGDALPTDEPAMLRPLAHALAFPFAPGAKYEAHLTSDIAFRNM